jgi:uncharacterized protein (TIRG00374 family)
LLAGAFGILLFAYLVHRAGPAKLAASISTLGWGLGLVLVWGAVAHIAKAWAWQLTLLDDKRQVSFARLLGLRLGSEACGQLGGVGQLFGEGMRVSLLGPSMSLSTGIASVTIDRVFFVLSAATVTVFGLLAVLVVLPLGHRLTIYASVTAAVLLGVILLSAIAIRQRWPVFSGAAKVLARIPYCRKWIEHKFELIHSVEATLLDFYHRTPRAFWASFTLNLACHVAAVFEVFLILWLMGAKLSLFGALAVEALTKLVNIAGTFNPGNVGTYEGGNMLITKLFGLTASTGLTLACIRRLRALFWAGLGGVSLVILTKRTKRSNLIARDQESMQTGHELIHQRETETANSAHGSTHVAVVLANNLSGAGLTSPLPRVGEVPILLRSILGSAKAGAARICVVMDRAASPQMQRDLLRTGRLPNNVYWRWLTPGKESLPRLLGQIASEADGHLVLIAGDRVYHSSLHKRAAEWGGEGDALTFATGPEVVGVCSISREAAINLASTCPSIANSTEDIVSWLTMTNSARSEFVAEEKWQLVQSEPERVMAERKLDAWLVKPTDGIFARANRRISIPISRRLIPFPITPNMVSLFTLGVSFAGGVFLALGGYWNMLFGAVLSWFSSVLDGCDGEVARLKLQESAFGCWLETICDNLYYLFTFAGLTIGLVRTTGNRNYLVWGCFLLLGATASFLMTGVQRHQLTRGRPEQYLREWHKKADNRSSNPLLYLGRHTEFMIRRCFLPYLIMVFALFGVMNWLLVGAAIGANLVWMIALYSYLSFNSAQGTSIPRPAV